MQKTYIVRLTEEERNGLQGIIKKLKGTGEKVRRAQILLKADAGGLAWTDVRIAEAYSCRRQTVEQMAVTRLPLLRSGRTLCMFPV